MPISSIALAEILSARITALGAIPVTTDLQADNAENLLWDQLLTLLGGDAEELSNLFAFADPTGSAIVANSAVATPFPVVTPVVLNAQNFPLGTMAEIKVTGNFVNGTGAPVEYILGFTLGAAGFSFGTVAVAGGGSVDYAGSLRFIRNDAADVISLGGCLCINGLPSLVAFGTPPLAFTDGDPIIPEVTMDTADPLATSVLFSETVKVSRFLATQLIF